MTVGDSISASDRDLMKRLSVVLALVFAFTALFAFLERTYSAKFFDATGRAQWIWAQHPLNVNVPVAFFAAHDFDLPERRLYTHLKIVGDPEYTVYVNGTVAGGRRLVGEERNLDLYDISPLVKTGRNRIVVAVRAPLGAGGLIASIDIAPETENWVVTDGRWKIFRRWSPDLPLRDIGEAQQPMLLGEPPIGRWNYLTTENAKLALPPATVIEPVASYERMGLIPIIRTVAGISVATAERERATAFDFKPTGGRLRLTVASDHFTSRTVNVRFANLDSELGLVESNLRPIVFAPGEHVVTTAESHLFRYAMAFATNVKAEVVR